jgi:hypothetical protein
MASMDELATSAVRLGDCHLVAHIAARSNYHNSSAGLRRTYAHRVVQLRKMVLRMMRELAA